MKRLLVAAFACLLGFGTAWAAVEGNNTAVVVRKAPVVSKTGYQFIGLPVRGFDITGRGQSKTLPLADVLPPASYPVGTTLQVVSNDVEGATELVADGVYKISGEGENAKWTQPGSDIDFGTYGVANGAVLWLQIASDTPVATNSFSLADILAGTANAAPVPAAAEDEPIVFAGEKAEKDFLVDAQVSGMEAFTNSTSEAVALLSGSSATTGTTKLVEDPQDYDQLLRVVDNENAYIYYEYVASYDGNPGYWYLMGVKESAFEKRFTGNFDPYTIQPGEAFFYYRASAVDP